jgi:PPOX class probable F420-dependent enzyme
MTYEWEPDHRRFADAHLWAVLATGRKDGSPQQSMFGYAVDDEGRLVTTVKSYTAKWHNAVRRPKVSLTIPDGREHLVIYGHAEPIDTDPLRAELSAMIFGVMTGTPPADPASIVASLDEQRRTILRITPTQVMFHP